MVDIIFVPDEKVKELYDFSNVAVKQDEFSNTYRLRNIRIAAIIDERGNHLKDTGRTEMPRYVSLEVSDKQDEFLAFAKGAGRIELSVIP